ncbi:olfactory receptor 11A1-like [Pelobates fuscus]|uniref:olfactory receptor 11A1-like n=1 Tax=Pelobates fuscus TaxID=191477 RepID=UPI002FE4D112
MDNQTTLTEFILLGFNVSQNYKNLIFVIFLITYVITVTGNILIFGLVCSSNSLHTPMYVLLCNLSLSEIFFTTTTAPNMMHLVLNDIIKMSLAGCLIQFYLFASLATTDCLLLAVMSYDRYLAICNSLRYNSLIDISLCIKMAIWCWAAGFGFMFTLVVRVGNLRFCDPKYIDHFMCDFSPIITLSCSDTSTVQIQSFILTVIVVLLPFMIIIVSYMFILGTIFSISSVIRRQKVFSTCSSHLMVVSMYYGTLLAIYLVPSKGQSTNVNKILSLLYTVVTPLFNPIIYGLRSKEIQQTLIITLSKCYSLFYKRSLK